MGAPKWRPSAARSFAPPSEGLAASLSQINALRVVTRAAVVENGPGYLCPPTHTPQHLDVDFCQKLIRILTECRRSGPDRKGRIDPGHIMRPVRAQGPHPSSSR
jgi:hypothetical protein